MPSVSLRVCAHAGRTASSSSAATGRQFAMQPPDPVGTPVPPTLGVLKRGDRQASTHGARVALARRPWDLAISLRMAAGDAQAAQLEALRNILEAAHELAMKLAADPLMERLLQVFTKLPEPDREPILQVIERDATWCRIVEQTSPETGITVRPNPH